MPGCEALKSSATLRSTVTCSGASPVPRQQYQRMTTSPGFACVSFAGSGVGGGGLGDSSPDAAAEGDSDAAACEPDGDVLDVDWLHAAKSSASTDRRTANRPIPTLMTRSSVCGGRSTSCSSARSSYAYGGFDRGRSDGSVDRTFDEIRGAIAADERPAELDRDAVGAERDAFDEERRCAPALVEEAGLSSPEEDGLEGLACADDLRVVARRQEFIEGAVLQIHREQAREAFGWQVHLFEEVWLVAGEPQPFEVEGG